MPWKRVCISLASKSPHSRLATNARLLHIYISNCPSEKFFYSKIHVCRTCNWNSNDQPSLFSLDSFLIYQFFPFLNFSAMQRVEWGSRAHRQVSSRRTIARTMDPSMTSVKAQISLKGVPFAHSYTTCSERNSQHPWRIPGDPVSVTIISYYVQSSTRIRNARICVVGVVYMLVWICFWYMFNICRTVIAAQMATTLRLRDWC